MLDLGTLNFDKGNGLLTVVAVDADSGAVLMVAHADREALEQTIASGEMHYRSRTRGLWHKGATSGNVQRVVALVPDCDGDAVLARVRPAGPACHTGAETCFVGGALPRDSFAKRTPAANAPASDDAPGTAHAIDSLSRLDATIASRAGSSDAMQMRAGGTSAAAAAKDGVRPSYTRRLLDDRNLRLKKLGEEATELAVACADQDGERAVEEAADLLYHMLVALRSLGKSLDDVGRVLGDRSAS